MQKDLWDSEIETKPINGLKELQLKRLKKLINYVYKNNKFYNSKLKEAQIKPDNIKTLKDIEKLPFLTKQDLRNYYPFGLVCTQMDEIVEIHASSGTTGKPIVGSYTRKDVELWGEVMARSLWANGVRKNDRMQNAYGYGFFTGAHGFEKGAQKIGAMVITISSGNTQRQINVMKDFGSTVLACTPSYSLHIAEVAEEMGFNPSKDFNLRIGTMGAESWSDEIRNNIEKRWGIKAYEHYGLTEIIGPGIVSECKEKKLHINADHFLPEIIDPDTGKKLSTGEEGELVLTHINREAMPMFRYRTRDLTRFIPEPCPCGRTHRRIERIKGRTDDMLIISGVNVFPSQIETVLMNTPEVGNNYQIVLERENNLDRMHIRVELYSKMFHGDIRELERLKKKLGGALRAHITINPRIELLEPGSLPPSQGKAQRVIDKRTL